MRQQDKMTRPKQKRNCQYILHVALRPDAIKPMIWRRLAVDGKVSLGKLHHFIQAAFGWNDAHLHEYIIGDARFGDPNNDEFALEEEEETRDERKALLNVMFKEGDTFIYLYDFGDSWEHVVTVESIEPKENDEYVEACILDGANACPPEDVGGVDAYQQFLETLLSEPYSEESKQMAEWIGGAFHPSQWDIRIANSAIARLLYNGWGGK